MSVHVYGIFVYIFICGVPTVFLAGKSPNIWSYTVYIYGSGQPYSSVHTPMQGRQSSTAAALGWLFPAALNGLAEQIRTLDSI